MKIGYLQTSPIFGEKEKNFEQVSSLTRGVKADLLVLPELFNTGYAFRSKDEAKQLAETREGETAEFLKELSKQTEAVIVAGFAEKNSGKVYNSAMIVSAGKVIDTYRKLHLFYKESSGFRPEINRCQFIALKVLKLA